MEVAARRKLTLIFTGPGWKNAEFRSYYVIDGMDGSLALQETAGSRQRREEGSQSWGRVERQEECASFRQQREEDAARLKFAKEAKGRRRQARREEHVALRKCAAERKEKLEVKRGVDRHGGGEVEVTPKQAGLLAHLWNDRCAIGLPLWSVWIYLAAVLLVFLSLLGTIRGGQHGDVA